MQIAKMYRFEAAHRLPQHKGQCRNLHGHSYRAEFIVQGQVAPSEGFGDSGMLMDYGALSDIVKPIIAQLDHTCLSPLAVPAGEDIGPVDTAATVLGIVNTTAEELAMGLFEAVVDKIAGTWAAGSCSLVAVRVSETAKTWAEWRP